MISSSVASSSGFFSGLIFPDLGWNGNTSKDGVNLIRQGNEEKLVLLFILINLSFVLYSSKHLITVEIISLVWANPSKYG